MFKAHNTWCSIEKVVKAMEEMPCRENMKVWKENTIEDTIVVIEKARKAIKPEQNKFLLEKTVSRCCI